MATLNRTDRLTLDAFSDPLLSGPVYNKFTNRLRGPILNAKGVQIVNANMINCSLQLNDDNGQLFFWYYISGFSDPTSLTYLKCVRLHPSWFVPYPGNTAFTRNAYFNSGTELAAALNSAASVGGDDATFNPYWNGGGDITFTYDTALRRIVVKANAGYGNLALASADNPDVLNAQRGTTNPNNRIRMNTYNSGNAYATAPLQPYREGTSMNARIGFPLKYLQQGPYYDPAVSLPKCATSTGVPLNNSSIIGDTPPILLGVQNVNIYLNIAVGGGTDSQGRRHLIGSMPIEGAPYGVCSYTFCSVEVPALSTPSEIYDVTVELIADNGAPYNVWSGTNTEIGLVFYY